MVSMFTFSFVGFLLFFMIVIQTKPFVESSNIVNDNKISKTNQQLYEIYKIMRTDPRFATVSNKDLVLYIYKNFSPGNNYDIDLIKQKFSKQQQQQQQQ